MSPLSLFSKLKIAWDVMMSSPLYAIAFFLLLFLVFLFSTTNKENAKQSKKTYLLIYLAIAIYFLVQYGSSIGTLIDYAINQVFITYYFPNIVIYLITLLIANIILWKTLFSKKATRFIRIFNSCFYGVLTYLFILAISLIQELNLNVFQLEELYSSNQVRSLLELSMFFFVVWIALLGVYYLIRRHQQKKNKPLEEKTEEKDYEEVSYFPTFTPYRLVRNYKPQEEKELPVVKEVAPNKMEQKKEEPFTLEEYKIMLKILKEEQEKKKEVHSKSFDALTELYKSMED